MKILLFGCGVLGSVAAARLAQGGQDVTALLRGRRWRNSIGNSNREQSERSDSPNAQPTEE